MTVSTRTDPLEALRLRLGQWVSQATSEGIDYRDLATMAEQEFPEQVRLIQRQHLVEWIKSESRKFRTDEGAPKIGSFKGKAIQIDFWDVDMFRTAIDHYVQPARANLELARGLAAECQRRLGVVIEVPNLIGDMAEASATG